MNVTDQAIAFAKKLFNIYLEQRDFKKFRSMLSDTVSWVGPGDHEIGKSYTESSNLLETEENSRRGKFKILEQWYVADLIGTEAVTICSELTIKEAQGTSISPKVRTRFSVVCKLCGKEFKATHIHFSVPNIQQGAEHLVQELAVPNNILHKDFLHKDEALHEELAVNKTRYEIVAKYTGVVTFDYNIRSKQIVQPQVLTEKFGIPCLVEGAAESPLWEKVIHPGSLKDFKALFERIDNGESSANATILFTDVNNREVIYDIFLTNVFNPDGKPVHAVGLMTDITKASQLERERQYQQAMNCNKTQSYEANITQNLITNVNSQWLESLDIPPFQVFSDMVEYIGAEMVDLNHLEAFNHFFDRKTISAAFYNNKSQQIFQYRRREKDGCCNWVQNTMNIICDEITQDIKIRCYMDVITAEKEKEIKIAEEQRFYDLVMAKSTLVYEANITKDLFIHGHEKWETPFDIQTTGSYSGILADFVARTLHPDDIAGFNKVFLRDNMLGSYYSGQRDAYCEYRRKDEDGNMIWVSCNTHMVEDAATGDVLSFSYALNINAEKTKELALVYKAEHDTLTGLFNKGVTEQKIDKFMKDDADNLQQHAFFMFDIDRFKQINDNLGHAFGDGVLSQVARKIKDLFREDDIIGRIGGDEFVVLMKNIPTHSRAVAKAKQLCETLREAYTKGDKQYCISVSMGIAFYGEHGVTYKDLYKHADVALYAAKKNGRDQYRVYDETMSAAKSVIRNIDVNDMIETKSFDKNVVEYVFRILYESSDKILCINSVLDLVGKQYNVSRAYIFEDSPDGLSTTNTFEWCNTGIAPQKDSLKNITFSKLGDYKSRFNDQGIFYMADVQTAQKNIKENLEAQGIKSMLHFAITKDGKPRGFVGFDQCIRSKVPSKLEITELRSISNILGVFLLEMRATAMAEATKNAAISIVDSLNSYAYVIDKTSYQLLFVNESTRKISPQTRTGEFCHKAFWSKDMPCEDCPMKHLETHKSSKISKDMHNPKFDIWVKATASWIDWIDGRKVCLMDSVDITEYKQ